MSQTQAHSSAGTRGNKYVTLIVLLAVAAGFFFATVTHLLF